MRQGKPFVSFVLGALFLSASGVLQAADQPQVTQTEQSVQGRVNVLRKERSEQMPYLDKALIRADIHPAQLRAKEQFIKQKQTKDLQDIIARAIQVYTPAQAARERISLANRRIVGAVRALFPEATLELNKKDGSLSGDTYNSRSFRVNLRQPVFRGGILWNTLLQEKAGLEAAQKEYQSTIEDLVRDVATAYFEYERAQLVVEEQGQAVKAMEHYAEMSHKKHDEQIISEIEHLNAQSLYSQMKYDLETSKQEMELAKLDLQRFVDLDLEDELTIAPVYNVEELFDEQKKNAPVQDAATSSGEKDEKKTPPAAEPADLSVLAHEKPVPDLSKLVDLAYQHRATLQVEAAKLESARLQERVRWGEMMPKLDIIGEWGKLGEAFNEQDLTPSLRGEWKIGLEFNWNVGGNKVTYNFDRDHRAPSVSQFLSGAGTYNRRNSVSIGILDGLAELASIKEAEVSRLEQVIQLEKTEKEVVHDVKQAYYDYQKSRIRVQSTLQRADYRRRLVELSKHRLEKNEIQISEYLQAEIDLLQELGSLHRALADYYTAKAKLNHSIGIRDYLSLGESNGNAKA